VPCQPVYVRAWHILYSKRARKAAASSTGRPGSNELSDLRRRIERRANSHHACTIYIEHRTQNTEHRTQNTEHRTHKEDGAHKTEDGAVAGPEHRPPTPPDIPYLHPTSSHMWRARRVVRGGWRRLCGCGM
jgi:hypothetical protein